MSLNKSYRVKRNISFRPKESGIQAFNAKEPDIIMHIRQENMQNKARKLAICFTELHNYTLIEHRRLFFTHTIQMN